MFGGKKAPHIAEQESRDAGYAREFEYRTVVEIGVGGFDKRVNELAAVGWELINGCMAGTTHYGYMRRRLK